MARQRTVKYPPKRGKFTRRQIQRAVDKVVGERLEQEAREAAEQADATLSKENRPVSMETQIPDALLLPTSPPVSRVPQPPTHPAYSL